MLERILNGSAVVPFEVPIEHLSGMTEENNENPQ
jgi:hypothetical protein